MREFFTGWRRRIGLALLVYACFDLVLWLTSHQIDTGLHVCEWCGLVAPFDYMVAGDFLLAAIIILWPRRKRADRHSREGGNPGLLFSYPSPPSSGERPGEGGFESGHGTQ